MADGLVRVTVSVPYGTRTRLHTLVDAERRRRVLLAGERWNTRGLSAAERADVRLARTAWLAGLRQRGELFDTAEVVLEQGARSELAERGWNRQWPPAPETSIPGRWWGSRARGYPERIGASLPAELVTTVRAACWHTSWPAIRDLRQWRDAHPAPVPEFLPGRQPNPEHREYVELASRIVAPGTFWRAALDRMIPPA